MSSFLNLLPEAALTSLGMFWTAFWAFGLGYLVSAMIQVFVTEAQMKKTMGKEGAKSVALGTFFGFISSSCSFSALATTRALFAKGAGLVPSLAFLLASTNLVIELGIIIGVFLSWQFIVGEYVGGIILILLVWLFVKLRRPKKLIEEARENAKDHSGDGADDMPDTTWVERITSRAGWVDVAHRYIMEWKMVWKDVTVGFTVAGVIAVFVPASFFEALFIGAGSQDLSFFEILSHALIGPVIAFFTFIGSMGNIPLAAVLFANGVSFAGIIAFIFSDLVVFPVLRVQAKFYGLKMALYIAGLFLAALVTTALLLHYGFFALDMLPSSEQVKAVMDREFFKIDYTFFFNLFFFALSALFVRMGFKKMSHMSMSKSTIIERILFWAALLSYLWLAFGLAVHFMG